MTIRRQSKTSWMRTAPLAVVTTMVMVVGSGASAFALPARPVAAPAVSPGPAAHGVVSLKPHFVKVPNPAGRTAAAAAMRWPAASSIELTLATPRGTARMGAKSTASGTPVWAQAYGRGHGGPVAGTSVQVRTLDHAAASAAGVDGVVFTVSATDPGTTRVGVDYAGFAAAAGGNFGTRLRLVEYPACVLTTPAVATCRQATPLSSTNDAAAQTVSAAVAMPATTLVMAAAAETTSGDGGGTAGTFTATSLKPSGSWTGGGSNGSFTYGYPVVAPPAASGLVPQVALSYDSSSVDGETSTTGSQSSWVGDGWSTPASFIEQSFASCSGSPEGTASPTSTSDECYDGPILVMSLNGASTSLVWDAGLKVFKAQNDSGDVITHFCTKTADPTCVTGQSNSSGTYANDWYQVTERDGTVYSFGLNHLPGWVSGNAATNSVDSEPVFSAHNPATVGKNFTDPCYNATWSSSVCTMAYRWNLDYTKDVHGNAMAYYYRQDTNSYGENKGATTVSYVRDSHLARIDYGFTDHNAYGTVPDQIVFNTGDRCLSGTCDPLNATNAPNWPDVPFDLACASSCTQQSPSFFSTVRLTSIVTQQYSTSTLHYVPVDSYALTQTFPATNDQTAQTLWLNQLQHTGSDITAGGSTQSIAMPPVQFAGVKLPNRTDTTTGLPAYNRWRIQAVTTETGSVIGVSYNLPYPCAVPVTISAASDTSSCYPVSWTPSGYAAPIIDWFNKYAVSKVTQTDPTGGAPQMVTQYTYPGRPAWHFDDNEMVKAKYRTYGQFRGYAKVATLVGDGGNDPQAETDDVYYQGMSDDNNTTVVKIADSQTGLHEDVNQLAGDVLEQTTLQGAGGPVDHSTITSYWISAATATRTRTGVPDLTASWVEPVETYTRQATTSTGAIVWQVTETDTTYDATVTDSTVGVPTHVYTHTVPVDSRYDVCETDSYAPVNTGANLVGLTSQAETDSVACHGFVEGSPASLPAGVNALGAPSVVTRPDQVIADTLSFYDDPSFATTFPYAAAPAKGDVTMTRKATTWSSGGGFAYQTTAQTTYDSFGRVANSYDGDGNKTATAYTMNSVGLTVAEKITNPLVTNGSPQSTSTTLDPERGSTLTAADLNGVVTTSQYDALGRITSGWADSRLISTAANYLYTYQVSNTGITAVTAQKMDDRGLYVTSTEIYDAMLRPRQTQNMTEQGGRLVTDTFYDSRGWKRASYNGWWDPATTPNSVLVSPAALNPVGHVYNEDFYSYDGLGRAIVDTSEQDGVVVAATTTVYNGNQTTAVPPAGGIVTATKTDPQGHDVEVDQYTATPTLHTPASPFTGYYTLTPVANSLRPTTYCFDGHGDQREIIQGTNCTTPTGPAWTSTSNLLGQVVASTDPDSGASSMQYDGAGNLRQTTDASGKTISFAYDGLNRKIGEYDSDQLHQTTTDQLAKWVYDNSDNAVPGMTYPLGHLTSESAYIGGAAYVTQHSGFNSFGESLGETVTIPSSTEGAILGQPYTYSHVYTPTTGLHTQDKFPNAGGLPAETVAYNYTSLLDEPTSVNGLNLYETGTTYDAFGRVTQQTIGASPSLGNVTNTYDPHSGRLSDQLVTRSTGTPTNIDEQSYAYDQSGNITRQLSTRLGSATTSETQCFTYDSLDQLVSGWTATDSCAATPTATSHSMVGDNLGTPSAYWTSWTTPAGTSGVDALGDRINQVQHSLTGAPDTNTSYTYDGNGGHQPHTLTGTTTTGGVAGSTLYGYDVNGNMNSRISGQGSQSLLYNDAGQLTSIAGGTSGNATYKYDADGSLLVQTNATGTTLYLPGEQITLVGTITSGVRYYALPGGGEAVRTGSGTNYSYVIADLHSTPDLYLDRTLQTPAWRQYTPYGAPRGPAVTTPDNHGFLNKAMDAAAGLTTVGARDYDPVTGRFTTLDPELESTSPGQLNGYSYTANNPITSSDPDGKNACSRNPQECQDAPPPPPAAPPAKPKKPSTPSSTTTNTWGPQERTIRYCNDEGWLCVQVHPGTNPHLLPCPQTAGVLTCTDRGPWAATPECGAPGTMTDCPPCAPGVVGRCESPGEALIGDSGSTSGVCGSAAGQGLIFNDSVSMCAVSDGKYSATIETYGAGFGGGVGGSATGGIYLSNGDIKDQLGPFQSISVGGGSGVAGGVTVANSGSTWAVQGDLGLGFGLRLPSILNTRGIGAATTNTVLVSYQLNPVLPSLPVPSCSGGQSVQSNSYPAQTPYSCR